MADFDIPKGLPKLDNDYWAQQKGNNSNESPLQAPLFDINKNFRLKMIWQKYLFSMEIKNKFKFLTFPRHTIIKKEPIF